MWPILNLWVKHFRFVEHFLLVDLGGGSSFFRCHTRPNLEVNLRFCKLSLANWATEWHYCSSGTTQPPCVKLEINVLCNLGSWNSVCLLWLGQVRTGQVRDGQDNTGQVRKGQVRIGHARTGSIRTGQVRRNQARKGQVWTGQVKTDPVRTGQVRIYQVGAGQVRTCHVKTGQDNACQVRIG